MTPLRLVEAHDDIAALEGEFLGVSSWLRVEQRMLDEFARVTGDGERIHLDPDAARAMGFESTIAHGLLTLSLGPRFVSEIVRWPKDRLSLNYGFDRVRMTAPVPVGCRVRMKLTCIRVVPIAGGMKVSFLQEFEVEGSEKPACVATSIIAFLE